MNKYQAEKIINRYGAAIANNPDTFKRQSSLPCSKARIRYAFYVYIAAIVEDFGGLPREMGDPLVASYGLLDSFVSDASLERLNETRKKTKSKRQSQESPEDKQEIEEYFSALRNVVSLTYISEINDYIVECYKEKGTKT